MWEKKYSRMELEKQLHCHPTTALKENVVCLILLESVTLPHIRIEYRIGRPHHRDGAVGSGSHSGGRYRARFLTRICIRLL